MGAINVHALRGIDMEMYLGEFVVLLGPSGSGKSTIGEETLVVRVRLVEPSAFTHISALGVEEQRVNVIGDFVGTVDDHAGLGDNYRVETSIVVWRKDKVTVVPTSALYRHNERWAVFVIKQGHAHLSEIEIGKRNANFAEVLGGVDVGESVIVHPSDKVANGVAVVRRE